MTGSTDYNKDLIDRFNHGELMNADSIHFPDSLKVQTKKPETYRLRRRRHHAGLLRSD